MLESLTPYIGFAIFVVVSITTPGPNNIMTLHSGARYGIARTVPLIMGIQFGFAVMMAIIAYGSAIILSQIENAANVLRIVCFAYLLFLAWRISSAPAPDLCVCACCQVRREPPESLSESLPGQAGTVTTRTCPRT